MNESTVWICCGVIRREIEALHQQGKIGGRCVFFDSMLHLSLGKLEDSLYALLREYSTASGAVVLVVGDCCPGMRHLAEQFNVSRVKAINCGQMLLGPGRYRELMKARSFVILPEWSDRWRKAIGNEIGLDREQTDEMIREQHDSLVYLDTGLIPVPREYLVECSDYTKLPWRVEPVGLDRFLELLLEAEATANRKKAEASHPNKRTFVGRH